VVFEKVVLTGILPHKKDKAGLSVMANRSNYVLRNFIKIIFVVVSVV
jgi:hypothetical protein